MKNKRTIGLVATALTFLMLLITIVARQGFNFDSCLLKPPDEKRLNDATEPEYFSPDYSTARRRFLNAASTAGTKVESFRNPHNGPRGNPLFTDVALVGSDDASRIIVLSSGTHGVEGFAGSAVQTGLLSEDISKRLPKDTAVLMIHAINPYGMAHLRRFNEDNVDLNRNFVIHSNPYPSNEGYKALADVIAPTAFSSWDNFISQTRLLSFRFLNGENELRQAISGGQYDYPEGLFFGGRKEAWSNQTIRKVVKRYLNRATRVVLVDVHTGLGPFAGAEIIISEQEDSPASARALSWWGEKVKNTVTGESISVPISGPLKTAFVQMPPATEVTAVSLEFGTYPAIDVFHALRNENWVHHHAEPNYPHAKEIKSCLLEAFRPDSERWKASVWRQGKEVMDQVIYQGELRSDALRSSAGSQAYE